MILCSHHHHHPHDNRQAASCVATLESITSDSWVLWIIKGYRVQWSSCCHLLGVNRGREGYSTQWPLLLGGGGLVMEMIPPLQQGKGFCSRLSPRKEAILIPVLDLLRCRTLLKVPKFRMLNLQYVPLCTHGHNWRPWTWHFLFEQSHSQMLP